MTKEISLVDFSDKQIALIKSQIAPKATDSELQLFLYQAKRTGLDPLTRQIYAIHRACKENVKGEWVWVNKMSIQTSIDGFRVIAERSGDYAGQDEPLFVEENGKLIYCKVAVYRFRGDVRYQAAVGVAYWSEYVQTDKDNNPSGLWKKMPHTMLAKVAEALALRKAYPQDLSGLYTGDEMAQAEEPKPSVVEEVKPPVDVTPASPFFKKPEGALAELAAEASGNNKAGAEEKRLDTLKNALDEMGSIAEVDGYLEGKYNGRTRLQVLEAMSEINAAQAKLIIANAKLAIDPDYKVGV